MRLCLINGPAGSGKDYLVQQITPLIVEAGYTPIHLKLSAPLKEALSQMSGVPIEKLDEIKSTPLWGSTTTGRDFQIEYFKTLAEMFGEDILARMFIQKLGSVIANDKVVVLVSDCGRQPEVDFIYECISHRSIVLTHMRRKGHTYAGDIRHAVECPEPAGASYTFQNVKDPHQYAANVQELLRVLL